MADSGAAAGGCALLGDSGAAADGDGKRKNEEVEGESQEMRNAVERVTKTHLQELRKAVNALTQGVAKLLRTSCDGKKIWEALITVWDAAVPDGTHMDLSGISCLTDAALTRLASFDQLTTVILRGSSGFTAAGIRELFSLTGLECLDLAGSSTTDAALDGIDNLKSLRTLALDDTKVTDAGITKLLRLPALRGLGISGCVSVTSASMVHVGKLTALECLTLHESGVREDSLQHLTALTSLSSLTLPPGVTDSGMKYLRNMKRLETLGSWDANITAAGVNWLKGLTCLRRIATQAEDVEGFVRDAFPGMIVTPGPL
ncbi:hypothetical protein CLOM_g1359 [Closterium sp. NIES-68]|nr:hypothetical protein CLOM_g1359 [Closterium sp. NIES-68]GJP63504.1 hypothetical protein CLOP_g20570 [Closterium sp. NIES-67]